MPKITKQEREEAISNLRKMLRPGDVVYTTLKHRSSSGMMRVIDLRVIRDNEPLRITWSVAAAIDAPYNEKHEGVRMDGCGMDMGFAAVYSLSRVLFPDGFDCIGQGCPSNDHSNGDRDYSPHHHTDGGYALRHRWM